MSSRLAGIPLDHVAAEIAAFPLASAASLELRATELDPLVGGGTAALWRCAEASLIGGLPSFSLDEIVALRDRIWFSDVARTPTPMHRYVRGLARAFLVDRGVEAHPSLSPDERWERSEPNTYAALSRRAWHWMSLALPPDLLLGALGDGHEGPSRVNAITPVLEKHLNDHGFAETHLHVGAALDFELLWAWAMRTAGRSDLKGGAFRSAGAELQEGALFGPWLLRAAIARMLLAAFLSSDNDSFLNWLHDGLRGRIESRLGPSRFSVLLRTLTDLEAGQLTSGIGFETLQGLYVRLAGPNGLRSVRTTDPRDIDPVGAVLDLHARSSRAPEVQLVARALSYLEQRERRGVVDRPFTVLFWQVVRIRSLFFRHVVHRPLTPGLLWFVRFYDRSKEARRGLSIRLQLESARRICGDGLGLRSLEIRTAPDSSRSEQQGYVQAIADVAANWRRRADSSAVPEVGLVLHFIKTRAGGIINGCPAAYWSGSNADPRARANTSCNRTGFRYARFYEDQRRSAMSVEWLLRHRPFALEILRGFDVCTDEVAVPTWVLAPLLNRVRAAAEDGAQAMQVRYGWSPALPRTTAHAGEDFVHLLTGMRLLDEAIEGFRLVAGDRIGHGLSLGVDPIEWAKRAGMVPVAQEDRLFDLVWEGQFYARHGGCSDASRLSRLQREVARLSQIIFDPGRSDLYDARDIEQLWRDLLDPWMLYRVGFPSAPNRYLFADGDRRLRLLVRYLTSDEVFRRGRTLAWVETAPEAETLAGLQAQLRRKIGHIGITIEVNPTSNLLIGDLNDLTRHPLWRLRPFRQDQQDPPPVSVCIGSDDPLVFNSNLRQEYQNLCDAMMLGGCSEEEIRVWIDRTRESGMESRFTKQPRSDSILCWYSDGGGRRTLPI